MSKRSDQYPFKTENGSTYYSFADGMGKIHLTHSSYTAKVEDHSHNFVELVCITAGEGVHIINGKEYKVCRGDLFIIDYGTSHFFRGRSSSFSWINCIFKPEYLMGITTDITDAKKLLYYILKSANPTEHENDTVSLNTNLRINGEDVVSIFYDMLREYDEKSCGYQEIIEHYLLIVLKKISRKLFLAAEDDKKSLIMEKIRRDIDNAQLGSISAKQLADSYFMSKTVFSENFKKYMGVSFREYVTKMRIEQACRLLLDEDYRISDIQSAVGYHDTKSFYRAFRYHTGMTPSEYKNSKKR